MNWLKTGACAVALLTPLVTFATPAAASPYHIPDADAAETWELKVSAEFESADGEDVRDAPVFDVTAPIRPGLETSLTFGWGVVEEAGIAENGFLDFEWAMKAEVLHQANGAWASVTIEPAIIAPTGTGGLSAHEWSFELPLIVSREFGALEVRGLAEYSHGFSDNADDEMGLGLLASYSLSDTLSVGVEIGRESTVEDFDATGESAGVGFKWEFARGYELQARVGRTREDGVWGDETSIFLERAF
jgi:hypothetical protein